MITIRLVVYSELTVSCKLYLLLICTGNITQMVQAISVLIAWAVYTTIDRLDAWRADCSADCSEKHSLMVAKQDSSML